MRKKRGKTGWMEIKIDLEKVFDMLKWEFIKKTLVDIGLLNHMVNLIWSCFSTPYMNVLWNVKFWRNFPQREASDKAIPYHLTSTLITLNLLLLIHACLVLD